MCLKKRINWLIPCAIDLIIYLWTSCPVNHESRVRLPEANKECKDGKRTLVASLPHVFDEDTVQRNKTFEQRHQMVWILVCIRVSHLSNKMYNRRLINLYLFNLIPSLNYLSLFTESQEILVQFSFQTSPLWFFLSTFSLLNFPFKLSPPEFSFQTSPY